MCARSESGLSYLVTVRPFSSSTLMQQNISVEIHTYVHIQTHTHIYMYVNEVYTKDGVHMLMVVDRQLRDEDPKSIRTAAIFNLLILVLLT